MRDLTPLIIQSTTRDPVTNALNLKTQVAVEITLEDNSKIRLATALMVMSSKNVLGTSTPLDPVRSFQPSLRKISDIIYSRTGASDSAEFEVEHLSLAWAPFFAASSNDLDGCACLIYECFKKPDGTYEGDVIFTGEILGTKAGISTVVVSLTGDFSVKRAQVSRPVTQRCFAREFEDDICGHTGAPPGSTCSFIKEDAENGCRFWRWEFAFVGAPFMSAIDPATGNPVGAGIGSGGDGGGDSFDEPGRKRDPMLPIARLAF
jgi:hypothetical protein